MQMKSHLVEMQNKAIIIIIIIILLYIYIYILLLLLLLLLLLYNHKTRSRLYNLSPLEDHFLPHTTQQF